jgi:hypothetical protein
MLHMPLLAASRRMASVIQCRDQYHPEAHLWRLLAASRRLASRRTASAFHVVLYGIPTFICATCRLVSASYSKHRVQCYPEAHLHKLWRLFAASLQLVTLGQVRSAQLR